MDTGLSIDTEIVPWQFEENVYIRNAQKTRQKQYLQYEVAVYLGVSIEKTLVIVICHSSSILNLSNHVLDCPPGHPLCKTHTR